MRILYAHRTQASGAEGAHIRGVISGLRALGHTVDVLTPHGLEPETAGADPSQAVPAGPGEGGSLVRRLLRKAAATLPQLVFELLELAYNAYSFPRTYWLLRRGSYALYYERYALFNVGGLLAARFRRVPAVTEVNDSVRITRSRLLVLRALARALEAKSMALASRVVTVSGPFRDCLAAYGVAVEEKTHVIPNAVDPSRFTHAPQDESSRAIRQAIRQRHGIGKRRVLGVSGAFVAWHGLPFLLDAVADMLEPQDLHVLLVGDGPARSEVERAIQQHGIAERVTLTGFRPPEEALRYLAAFDVGLMPDSNAHGSPMKIFEYMAAGVPVVAARYRPIEEVVSHGETGLLFEPRDAGALRSALVLVLGDAQLRERLGRRAREVTLANYTWQRVAERTLALLWPGSRA